MRQHFTASDPPIWYEQNRGLAVNATHEEWRPVVGYEGCYEVSDRGRVKSLTRLVPSKAGSTRTSPGRLLATPPTKGGGGYPRVSLGSNTNTRFVHLLVLEAFVGPRPEGMEGCHNDGNPANNRLDNLRWDTHSSNISDAVQHGTHTNASKTHCPQGHPKTPENTYIAPKRGERQCRICRRAQFLAFHERKG